MLFHCNSCYANAPQCYIYVHCLSCLLHREYSFLIALADSSMLCREIIAVYCENYTQITVWGKCVLKVVVPVVSHRDYYTFHRNVTVFS